MYVTICAGLTRQKHILVRTGYPLYTAMCSMQNLLLDPLHVINFTRPSPMLVLQATNTGVRSPGYEATIGVLYMLESL